MFEKFTDFNGKRFPNLWGDFSCECFVDGVNTFVMFYIKDKEVVLSFSGNDANDILDFVLSKYYENENSTIEDGFSNWLMEHYDNVIPTFDGVEPKFKVGDWIACKELKTAKIININGDRYEVEFIDGIKGFPHIDYIDRIFHLWSINDAKDGDVLFQDLMGGKTFIYNGINPDMAILYSFIINNDGEDVMPYHIGKPNTGIGYIEENKNIIHPATKEQCDTLFAKMHEAGYGWDNEKKGLKKIENEIDDDKVKLSVSYKTLLKKWKRQNRIIKKQKKEIKKLQMRINELSSGV